MKKLFLVTTLALGAITYPPVQAKFCEFCESDDFNKLLATNPKVVVDFFAPWCGPCKAMSPHFEALGNEMNNVLFIKINCDKFPAFGIQSFPTLMAYKNGKKVATSTGYKSKTSLKNWVNSALS